MSRPHTNAKRSEIKPGPHCVDTNSTSSKIDASAGGGTKNKQYAQTGKKYSGPNYPQKDKTIVYTKEI